MSSSELTLKGGAPAAAAGDAASGGTALRRAWRLKWGLAATAVMLAIGLVTAFAPSIAPHDPLAVDIRHRLAPPAWMAGGASEHLLGTDQVGRDLLSRVIYGGRVSLVIGVSAVAISATLGVLLGLSAPAISRGARTGRS